MIESTAGEQHQSAAVSSSHHQSPSVDHKVIQIKQIEIVGFDTDRDTKRPTVSLLLSIISTSSNSLPSLYHPATCFISESPAFY